MEQIISKEELEELKKIEGELRGVSLKGDAEFVVREKGEEGLKRLEDAMADLGYPIKYKGLVAMNFYPLSLDAVNLLVIKRLFDFDDKKIQELGGFLSKVSLILKMFMRYFVSIEKVAKEAPVIWKRNYTVGDLKLIELNQEKKHLVLRLDNFNIHPLYCHVLMGYFSSVVQMVVKERPVCEETKCQFKGDKFHEFVIKW